MQHSKKKRNSKKNNNNKKKNSSKSDLKIHRASKIHGAQDPTLAEECLGAVGCAPWRCKTMDFRCVSRC